MSEETKMKPVRRRAAKAASSPIPMGPACGHEGGCGEGGCKVRYVGPVSHLTDHHSYTAARASSHIWGAALITSLALVVTGAVAFNSVEAAQTKKAQEMYRQNANRGDIEKIITQLNRIERNTKETLEFLLKGQTPKSAEEVMDSTRPKPPTGTLPTE
ncbi:hypothetical protein IT407_05095 [Candidatus Uhrbacteria bacterium]|nr:hypothetical protein [Candidatus Uhrbacteria bacterium]